MPLTADVAAQQVQVSIFLNNTFIFSELFHEDFGKLQKKLISIFEWL